MASVFKRGVDKGVKGSCYYVGMDRHQRQAADAKGIS